MKPLSIIAFFFAAFLIILGYSARAASGVLSYAVMIGGGLILIFLAVIWGIYLIQESKEKPVE